MILKSTGRLTDNAADDSSIIFLIPSFDTAVFFPLLCRQKNSLLFVGTNDTYASTLFLYVHNIQSTMKGTTFYCIVAYGWLRTDVFSWAGMYINTQQLTTLGDLFAFEPAKVD